MAVLELSGTKSELVDLLQVCSEEEIELHNVDMLLYEVEMKNWEYSKKVHHYSALELCRMSTDLY